MTKLEKKQSLLNRARRLEKEVRQMIAFTNESVQLLLRAQNLRSRAKTL